MADDVGTVRTASMYTADRDPGLRSSSRCTAVVSKHCDMAVSLSTRCSVEASKHGDMVTVTDDGGSSPPGHHGAPSFLPVDDGSSMTSGCGFLIPDDAATSRGPGSCDTSRGLSSGLAVLCACVCVCASATVRGGTEATHDQAVEETCFDSIRSFLSV